MTITHLDDEPLDMLHPLDLLQAREDDALHLALEEAFELRPHIEKSVASATGRARSA